VSGSRPGGFVSWLTSTTPDRTFGWLDGSVPADHDAAVIRNAILHIINEQPMLADLFEAPAPDHVGLRCTNLRQMNGKRPVFIDESANIFFFPYLHLRFIEMPAGSVTGSDPDMAMDLANGSNGPLSGNYEEPPPPPEPEPEAELEIDEDFLRRIREV
jgi:hypothetical protein